MSQSVTERRLNKELGTLLIPVKYKKYLFYNYNLILIGICYINFFFFLITVCIPKFEVEVQKKRTTRKKSKTFF